MRGGDSLDANYFEGIFRDDADPWSLASSAYEAAKFDETIAALSGRSYVRALEVGCAQGVLTGRLAPLCHDLLAIDISAEAIALARRRVTADTVRFEQMAFPRAVPGRADFDLILLSEVAYYWSDADLAGAAAWLAHAVVAGGRILLVHWLGETDYPQTGDAAVEALHAPLARHYVVETACRTADYRLDLWRRR